MKIIIKRPLVVFAAGLVLVGASSVGATRAAISYSKSTEVDYSTSKMKVDLQEGFLNEETEDYTDFQSVDNFLVLPSADEFKVGKVYEENLRAYNNSPGGYPEYVRITVKKYWYQRPMVRGAFTAGKDTSLNPKYINLGLEDGWIIDDENEEGATYYYTKPLNKDEAAQLINSVQISNDVWKDLDVRLLNDSNNILFNDYRYDDKQMFIEVEVDAVQAHNGAEAMLGAWGVNAEFDGDELVKVNGSSKTTGE